MTIKYDGRNLLKRYYNGQEVQKVMYDGHQIRPDVTPPTADYLCFTANTNGSTIRLGTDDDLPLNFEISYDKENRTDYTWEYIRLNAGDSVYFRNKSETVTWFNTRTDQYQFSMTGSIAASGDVNYLLCKYSTTDLTPTRHYTFYGLFSGCSSLTSAPSLPATTLVENCYMDMFTGCTNLTTAPNLPATTLPNQCYFWMFERCTSLTTTPQISATTVGTQSCSYMFDECTGLTTATILPATTLGEECYSYMFNGCTSLTTAPILPATTLASQCYNHMFHGCTSLVTPPALPATNLSFMCYGNMFYGCTSLATAPNLPATVATRSCYSRMFYNCTSLVEPPELPATTIDQSSYYYMFRGCTSLTSLPALPANKLYGECYRGMFSGCTNIKISDRQIGDYQIPYIIPTSGNGRDATDALTNMFYGTGGEFTGTPTINTTYYTANPVIVSNDYLCFTANTNGSTVELRKVDNPTGPVPDLEISYNKTSWVDYTLNTVITLNNAGDKVYFRSKSETPIFIENTPDYGRYQFYMTGSIAGSGDVGTLLCKYSTNTILGNFYYLFGDCTSLTSAPELPATTLGDYCYNYMFRGCTNLITPPSIIPASSIPSHACNYMFYRCSSLISAPELPATTIGFEGYGRMFSRCTSLVNVPKLPATSLSMDCYEHMFYICTSLESLPELPATTLESRCYQAMFSGCTKIKLSATQTGEYQTPYRIPSVGTGTAPSGALYEMFYNTGGTHTSSISINTTYYTSNQVI